MRDLLKKLTVLTLSAALLLQSGAGLIYVNAEPLVIEEAEDGPVDGELTDSDGEYEYSEDTEEKREEESGDSDNNKTDSSLSGNTVSADKTDTDTDDEEMVVGGYIEMPWDNDTPAASRRLDYLDAIDNIVDENRRDNVWIPDALGYVSEPETIESKFPSGGSESDILTYLKDTYPSTRKQSPYGSCWAHSAMALSEFYMIKHGLRDSVAAVDKDVNYSELQLAYFCYHPAPNLLLGDTGDRITFDNDAGNKKNFLNFGGNLDFAAQSLMRYNGVADETDDSLKYSNAAYVLDNGLSDEFASSNDVIHLKNEYQLNIKSNAKIVKQAIKENGIVGVSFFADDSGDFYNSSTHAYYNDRDTSTNHAVAIVGWDDDFPKSAFKKTPEGNGAWLIRNSWNTTASFSYQSYFWLSYYDTSLANTAYVYEMSDYDNGEEYDNDYYYDSQLHNITTADSKKTANVYTAVKDAETLKAVQIDSTFYASNEYKIEIYKNLSDASDPESGTKIENATVTGTLPFEGKYTIPLSEPVELINGESFSVVVTTSKYVDREMDFNWNYQIDMDTAINPGESFAYINNSWVDLSGRSNNGKNGNLCIRALTCTKGGVSLPDKITSITMKNRTDHSITLVWNAAKDADDYEIYYSLSAESGFSKAGETVSGERKYTCTGLDAATDYYFKVYPVKNGSRYDAGVSPVLRSSTLSSVPDVRVIKIGHYSAVVKWGALDNCDGYEYYYANSHGRLSDQTTEDNEVELRGLDPGVDYQVHVRSFKLDQNGNKEYSEYCIRDFSTIAGTGEAVKNLKAEPFNVSSVVLTWDEPEEADFYSLEQSEDGVNYERKNNFIGNRAYGRELEQGKKYYFRIVASYYKSGYLDTDEVTSEPVSSYVMLPGVTGMNVEEVNGSIRITWSAVSGAEYYSVYRKETRNGELQPLALISRSAELRYDDTTVLPGREYCYQVFGCRTNGFSNKQGVGSAIYGISTRIPNVTDLTLSNIKATSADMSWSPVSGAEKYVIFRGEQFQTTIQWTEIDRIDAKFNSYKLRGLTPETRYMFAVAVAVGEYYGGKTGISFYTLSKTAPPKSLFSFDKTGAVYNGSSHTVTVSSSEIEINNAGITLYYGKIQNDSVSEYTLAAPVDAGTYRLKIKTAATDNYNAAELTDNNWKFTVTKKGITPDVTLTPASFVYSGEENKPAVTLKDGSTALILNKDYTVSYSNNVSAGQAKATIKSVAGSNYSFDDIEQEFTVSKADVSDKTASGSVRYGNSGSVDISSEIVEGGSISAVSVANDDHAILNGAPSFSGKTVRFAINNEPSAVGKTAALTVNINGGRNYDDYIVTVTVTAIDKEPQVLSFGGVTDGRVNKTYGASDFIETATVTTGNGTVSYSSSDGTVATVNPSTGLVHIIKTGETVITATAAGTSGYSESSVSYTLTVGKKEIGLNWSDTAFTYDGQSHVPTAAATGLVNGDTCNISVTGAKTNAGEYTAEAATLDNSNYSLPDNKVKSFVINKRSVKVTGITVTEKTYDGNTSASLNLSSVTFDNKLDPDVLSVTAAGSFENADAGDGKSVMITGISLGGRDADNYTLNGSVQQSTATGKINKKAVSVKAKDQTVPLGDSIQTAAEYASLTGVLSGHSLGTVILTGSSTAHVTSAGTITPSSAKIMSGLSDVTGNYSITYETGVLKVTKINPSVTAPTPKSRLSYNGEAQELITEGSVSRGAEMLYSLSKSGPYSPSVPTAVDYGTYTVWYKVSGGNDYNDVSEASVSVNIKKAIMQNAVVTLGEALTYTGSELTQSVSEVRINGKLIPAGEYELTDNKVTNAGNYTLKVNALENKNCFGSKSVAFTVDPMHITPDVTVGSVSYNGTARKPEVQVKYNSASLDRTYLKFEYSDNINAGTGSVRVSSVTGGNYSFDPVIKTFTINKASHRDASIIERSAYGRSGSLNLSSKMERGSGAGVLDIDDPDGILETVPSVNGKTLSYKVKDDESFIGKEATVRVPVINADNYSDYHVTVTIFVTDKSKAEDSSQENAEVIDKVPLLGRGDDYASEEDNIAPLSDSKKINKMTLDLSNVPKSDVAPKDLKMTVIKGSKITTSGKLKDASSASGSGGIKVKVNKKTLNAVITCKSDGQASLTMEDGTDYNISFKVEKPKPNKSAGNISKGEKTVTLTTAEMFNTSIDSGELSVIKDKASMATVSDNSVIIDPRENGSIKLQYQYLNKKYKMSVKVK